MKIMNQHEHCRAEMALVCGKQVLRLIDAQGELRVQMDASHIQRVTISPTGQAQVVASPAQDYGLALYDSDGKPIQTKPKPSVLRLNGDGVQWQR